MYQSIPSLTPEGQVFAQLSKPEDWGFELEKFSTQFGKEILNLFQRNWRQNEKQVFLCCFISIYAKTVDVYCIFNNIDRFWPF